MTKKLYGLLAAAILCTLAVTPALAQSLSQKCQSKRDKFTGAYTKCLLRAEADLLSKRGACSSDAAACYDETDCTIAQTCDKDLTKYDKNRQVCADDFASSWDRTAARAESQGDPCPVLPTFAEAKADAETHVSSVSQAMTGTGFTYPACGDNTVNAVGEQCDGTDLGGETCTSLGFSAGSLACLACGFDTSGCTSGAVPVCGDAVATGGETCDGADLNGKTCATEAPSTPYGTLACNGSCDGFDTLGCKGRFTDNGDGTVTDNSTGLMWEKKATTVGSGTDFSNPHDVDNNYAWTAGSTSPNGTAFTDFLDKLNGQAGAFTGFAGHYDWRLPTREELEGILDLSAPGCFSGSPCIDAVFGATQLSHYWSSSTYQLNPTYAWYVNFGAGNTIAFTKTNISYVRAVRAGS